MPSEDVTVLTTPYEGDAAFDSVQSFRVVRTKQKWLLPTNALVRQINELAIEVDAQFIVLDPVSPLGLLGPRLNRPYVLVGHGAEFTIQAKMPVLGQRIKRVLANSSALVAGGKWVEDAMRNTVNDPNVPSISIPPGVDTKRFDTPTDEERIQFRERFGIGIDQTVIVGVSRLVPRKGFDRLIRAASLLKRDHPQLQVLIAGKGREHSRLQKLINELEAPVTLLGRVPDEELPALYGAADVFCMPCHDRWFGLEQEGFGIVFVEAASAGLPSVAGLSGGSAEAVEHGVSGLVVEGEVSSGDLATALDSLLKDRVTRKSYGENAKKRAQETFEYDILAGKLETFLNDLGNR